MKTHAVKIMAVLFILAMVSFTGKSDKDALSLYSELDRSSAPNTLAKKEKDKGWILLFNGTSRDGWHGYNLKGFPDSWIVEDGTFTMNSKGG